MFDIIMNAMQTLQYELGNFKAISADVLINPELSDFTWVEYYRSDELIQRGIAAAEQALPAIKRAYGQKLGPWMKRQRREVERRRPSLRLLVQKPHVGRDQRAGRLDLEKIARLLQIKPQRGGIDLQQLVLRA